MVITIMSTVAEDANDSKVGKAVALLSFSCWIVEMEVSIFGLYKAVIWNWDDSCSMAG